MTERGDGTGTALLDQPESPFLGFAEPAHEMPLAAATSLVETPFLTEYRLGDEVIDHEAGAARQLLTELFDTEFEGALEELLAEAETEAERLGTDETPAGDARAERILERWIEPLRLEAESMLERMATALDSEDFTSIGETELEEILDRFEPQETGLSPTFENFLGKVWRKAKKAVSGAAKLVKKGIAAVSKILPIGVILRKLGRLVRPLLQRVVKFALNKLPPALRPYAAQLAKRIVGELEMLDELDSETAVPAAADSRHLQLGFDAEIATLLLAPSDVEMEELVAEAGAVAEAESGTLVTELDEAREQFITRFEALEQGEDPTPLVEEFVPAILPLVRLGIRIAGRPKVVRFLAGYLGRLISPYVGPKVTPALSQAIVDAGLRLMTLETETEEPSGRVAAEAFANALEDTVRHVAQLSEDEWEDDLALEEAAYEGFHEAAAGSFPAGVLNPATESLARPRSGGTWIAMPRRRRPRYRKYSRVFRVTITPQVAQSIRTFGGRTLAAAIGSQPGRDGVIRARLHLYQAMPGARVGRILRAENRALAFGRTPPRGAGTVHPLTRETAAMLVGEPGLGSEIEEAFIERPEPLALGERLFYLELPTAQPAAGRPSGARLTIDEPSNELRLSIFLSEADAQGIAARLRRKEPLGASLVAMRRIYRPAIRQAIGGPRGRVRVVREQPELEDLAGGVVRLARTPGQVVARAIERWVRSGIATALARQADAFVRAAAAEADGVTLVVRVQSPPGLQAVAPLLRGKAATAPGTRTLGHLRDLLRGKPATSVEITPGGTGG
jgi:hypothetical protein